MALKIRANVCWIPAEFGGRSEPPLIGLRPMIRFQRDVAGWLTNAVDVQLIGWKPYADSWSGAADMAFSKDASPDDEEYLQPGELIELLDAYRVIGVGKILHIL